MTTRLLDKSQELAKPLYQQKLYTDYRSQHQAIMEFSNRLQSLAMQFEDLYSKIARMEEEIAIQKKML